MSTALLCLASFIVGMGVSHWIRLLVADDVEILYYKELERSHLLRREILRLEGRLEKEYEA